VELPLGATEDRVLGSLHLEKALRGERAFEPGLLAAANRGILYIDEVNLLPDHLVDLLLDAGASGVHRVEREGLSLQHPARFLLIGTMNPEEGDLRPQLLDRFGLVVDMGDLTDPADRAEAVRRRLDFEADPDAFVALWQSAETAEAERILRAQQLLPRMRIPEAILRSISERCVAAGAEGLRADLTLSKAACAWAAYQDRTAVEPPDVEAVAELALAHRRSLPPQPPSPTNRAGGTRPQTDAGPAAAPLRSQGGGDPSASIVLPSSGLFSPRPEPPARLLARSTLPGRRRTGLARGGGRTSGALQIYKEGTTVSWAATLRAAAPEQISRRGNINTDQMILHASDVRAWPRQGPAGCLLVFVVDASGSMAAWQRMRQTKAAVLALLVRAYQRRDRVAILTFRDQGAELVLPPSRGLEVARQVVEELAVGGPTPLAHGLAAARRLMRRQQRRQPRQPIWMVLLTDGRANVALTSSSPWQNAWREARALAALNAECLVVNTETNWPRFGHAVELARIMGASCWPLEEVLGKPLSWGRPQAGIVG
jgi:magnesium chelatase subunit D